MVQACGILDLLSVCVGEDGLSTNETKTVVLATETLPLETLSRAKSLSINILDKDSGHKWLGRMPTTQVSANHVLDLGPVKFASRCMPQNGTFSVTNRLRFSSQFF